MWHDVMWGKQQEKGLFSEKWQSDSPRQDCCCLTDSSWKVGPGRFTSKPESGGWVDMPAIAAQLRRAASQDSVCNPKTLTAKLACAFARYPCVLLGGLLYGSVRLPVLPLLRCIMNSVCPGNAVYPLCILNVYNSLSCHVKVITYDMWFLRKGSQFCERRERKRWAKRGF